jgi:hypothetical protein
MIIFYDPKANNQIRAVYTGDTTSKVWEERSYVRLEIRDRAQIVQILANGQDLRVVLDGGEPVGLEDWPRPTLTASQSLIPADGETISTITATFADVGYAGEVEWQVDEGKPVKVEACEGKAKLIFGPCEVPGWYKVRCISPTYGMGRMTMEVSDA